MSAGREADPRLAINVCADRQASQLGMEMYQPLPGWLKLARYCFGARLKGDWKAGGDGQESRQGRRHINPPSSFSSWRSRYAFPRRKWSAAPQRASQHVRVRRAGESGPELPVRGNGSAGPFGLVDECKPRRVEDRARDSKISGRYARVARKWVLRMLTALLCAVVTTASPVHDERDAFLPACFAEGGNPLGTLDAGTMAALGTAPNKAPGLEEMLVFRVKNACSWTGPSPFMQSSATTSTGVSRGSGHTTDGPQIGHHSVATSQTLEGGRIPALPGLPDSSLGRIAPSVSGMQAMVSRQAAAPATLPDHGIRLIPIDPVGSKTRIDGIGNGRRELALEGLRPETPDGARIGYDHIVPRFAAGGIGQLSGDSGADQGGSTGSQGVPAGEEAPAGTQSVQVVDLGTSGSITLTLEGGTWMSHEGPVADGSSIAAANGSSYTLRYRYGHWSAEFVPEVRSIVGTGLVATWLQDRSGYRVGTTAHLSKEGRGEVSVDGAMYRVWEEDGSLWGVRFDAPPHGSEPIDGHYSIGLRDQHIATLMEDDTETAANEKGTRIRVGGGDFSVDELLGEGSAASVGDRIVPDVLADILDLRNTAHALLVSVGDDPNSSAFLESELDRIWEEVVNNIKRIFQGAVREWKPLIDAKRAIDREEDIVEQFDAVVSALSSLEAFQAATSEHGEGIFREAKKGEIGAANLFDARLTRSEAILKATGDTRYGAVKTEARRQRRAEGEFSLRGPGAGAGVFAYSTIPDTERASRINLTGDSTYRGGATAVDGEGKFWTADLELEVRFANETVRGLITGLSDERGRPWVYQRGEVDAIFLPEAKLEFDADWVARQSRSNSALIQYEDRFVRTRSVSRSSFEGHLLGIGPQAGHQAVGAWSIGVPQDGTEYLAGAFGAVLVRDPKEDGQSGPSIPETATPETTVLPAGSDIEDGVLTLTGTLYGPNPETTLTRADWDDEILLLDEGRKIADVYELPLEEALARNGGERAYLGRNLIHMAFAEITDLRTDLAAVVGLGDEGPALLRERSRIWGEVNDSVQARIFGTGDKAVSERDFANDEAVPAGDPRKWSSGYPTAPDGSPEDAAALRAIDAVLSALRAPRALAEAVAKGEGGVFTRSDGSPFRPLAAGQIDEIWDRVDGRIQLWTESTDYTRFGAWKKQTAPNAWSDYRDRTENDENGPNAFAYSPLPEANYNDYRFPVGGTSRYSGRTVAVQGKSFYRGTINLHVRWHEPQRGQYDAGMLTAVISGLETEQGNAMRYVDPEIGGGTEQSIREIYFDGIRIGIDRRFRLHFSDPLPEVVGVEVEDIGTAPVNISSDPSVTASMTGKFVGRTPEGPQAAIGTWTVRSGGSRRIGTGGTIHGSFGVEVEP